MTEIWQHLKSLFSSASTIYLIIIIGLGVYIYISKNNDSNQVISVDVHRVDSIQNRVDTLEQKFNRLTPRIDSTNRVVDTVKKKILSNDTKIQTIQQTAKNQDSVVRSLNPDQLQQYFTNY